MKQIHKILGINDDRHTEIATEVTAAVQGGDAAVEAMMRKYDPASLIAGMHLMTSLYRTRHTADAGKTIRSPLSPPPHPERN